MERILKLLEAFYLVYACCRTIGMSAEICHPLQEDADGASVLVESQSAVLEACALRYPEVGRSLRSLLSLPFAPATSSGAEKDGEEDSGASAATAALESLRPFFSRPPIPTEFRSVATLQGRLARARAGGSLEELLGVLAEARERTSGSNVGLLGFLLPDLLPLLHHGSGRVRTASLRLLARHLTEKPGDLELLGPALRAAFLGRPEVAASARELSEELAGLGGRESGLLAVASESAQGSEARKLLVAAAKVPEF